MSLNGVRLKAGSSANKIIQLSGNISENTPQPVELPTPQTIGDPSDPMSDRALSYGSARSLWVGHKAEKA